MAGAWPFVGREAERDLLRRALRERRGALLIGPQGVGTTRLAEEVGHPADVVTSRDDAPLPRPVRDGVADGSVVRIDVGPLTTDELDELMKAALGEDIDPALRRWLHMCAGGNPFLLRELLADQLETGAVTVHAGRWSRADGPTPLTGRLLDVLVEHRSRLTRAEWRGRELVVEAGDLGEEVLVGAVGAEAVGSLLDRGMLVIAEADRRRRASTPSEAQRATVRARLGPLALREVRSSLIDVVERFGARRGDDRARVEVWRAINESTTISQGATVATCGSLGLSGRFVECEQQAQAGLRVAARTGIAESAALFGTIACLASLAQGKPRTALAYGDEALRAMLDVDYAGSLVAVLVNRAIAQSMLGLADEARATSRAIDALAPLHPSHSFVSGGGDFFGDPVHASAWVMVARGDVDGAVDVLALRAHELGRAGRHLEAVRLLHDVVRLGRADLARAAMLDARDLPHPALVRVGIEHALGLEARDPTAIRGAAEQFESMGARLLAAEASAHASALLASAGDRFGALQAARRSRRLAAACEGAWTPALRLLPDDGTASLTDRERHVARAAAAGAGDRAIADALAISVRTVESHLARVYTKLRITGRHDLALFFD